MIFLLGATGYIGQAFERELAHRGAAYRSLSRAKFDYTDMSLLSALLRDVRPSFLINAAGFTGKPNVDACETQRADTLIGNTILPQTIAHACAAAGVPWGHVSSGCIFAGAKIRGDTGVRVEPDLTRPDLRALVEEHPDRVLGFTEDDLPNFSFRSPPCSFYSGTKALCEELLTGNPQTYIWRLRIPFDEYDNGRNYLSKMLRYSKIYENVNSISHRQDFARACLDLWERRAPFGKYNLTNPGFITTRQVVGWVEEILHPGKKFEFWANDDEFYRVAAKTPRSNCVLDVSKSSTVGVSLRPVEEAIKDSLRRWRPESL